jgi:Ca2+-binding EF-hand superfamily protein
MDVLKTAGFVFNGSWIEVLEKFDHKKNNIVSYDQFLAAIKSK